MKEKYFSFQSLSYLSVKARESTRPNLERFHLRKKSCELKVMPTFPTGNSALGPVKGAISESALAVADHTSGLRWSLVEF